MRRVDESAGGTTFKRWYPLTDAQFSVRAVLREDGGVHERINYSPYGVAEHHWGGDADGNRSADFFDWLAIADQVGMGNVGIGQANYRAEMDLNRDGVLDADDASAIVTGTALPSGWISARGAGHPGNVIGFDGYVFNAEIETYSVRFRWYDPELGRWLQRDVLEYPDGMNRYQQSMSNPTSYIDPLGLSPVYSTADDPPGRGASDDEANYIEDIFPDMEAVERANGGKPSYYSYMPVSHDNDSIQQIVDTAEFLECIAECLADDPDKLLDALAKAGLDVAFDTVADLFSALEGLAHITFDDDGNPTVDIQDVILEIGETAGELIDSEANRQLIEAIERLDGANESIYNAIEMWLNNGGHNTEQGKVLAKVLDARSDPDIVRAARGRARMAKALKSGASGAKLLSKANGWVQLAAAAFEVAEAIAEECSEECGPCGE